MDDKWEDEVRSIVEKLIADRVAQERARCAEIARKAWTQPKYTRHLNISEFIARQIEGRPSID